MKPLIFALVIMLFAISSVLGDIPLRKPRPFGSARLKSAKLSTDETADVRYDIELMPGQIFTGYWYYNASGDTLNAHIRESPEVSWVVLEGGTFTSTSCTDIHALAIHFTAPTSPGVYLTNLIDDSSHWQTIRVTLTVTTTPTPDYTIDFQVTEPESLYSDEEIFYEGFPMGCLSIYVPGQTQEIKYSFEPELPQFVNTPSQGAIQINNSAIFTLAFGAKDTGMYSTMLIREDQWYTFPVFGKWNIHYVDTLVVKSPKAEERWVVGEPNTIRWESDTLRNIEIRFSDDGGANYTYLTTVGEDESEYVWYPPSTLTTSSNCLIKLTDALNSEISALSPPFTLRAYDLARTSVTGTMELFAPSSHGWSFANEESVMWPPSWYSQYDYPNINDEYTGSPFSTRFIVTTGAKREELPDWHLFVETFGYDKCYSSNAPTEAAMHAWKALKEPWAGACFGFPTSALLAFEQKAGFFSQHPGIPATESIFGLFLTPTIRNTVLQYYISQNDIAQIDHLIVNTHAVDVRELLAQLKEELLNESGDHKTLSMLNSAAPGAHTLIPFKLVQEESNPGTFQLFVYDCNHPGQHDIFIELDSLNNTWEQFAGLDYPPASSGLFLNLPVSHFLTRPLLEMLENPAPEANSSAAGSGLAVDRLTLYNTTPGEIYIVSPLGDTLGYGKGRYPRNIPNAIPIVPSVAVEHPPIGYRLPDDAYHVTMSNFSDSSVSVLLHDEGTIYVYEREDGDSAQTDLLALDNGLGMKSPDVQPKRIHLKTIIPTSQSELTIDISDLTINQNDSIAVSELNGNGLRLVNSGGSKTYHLHVGALSESFNRTFEHDDIVLSGNAAQHIIPQDSALLTVKILSDLGNDGTIEDSLVVDNQVLDVTDRLPGELPKDYLLAQNYPNPFNPSTEIRFAIRDAGYVTLRVYDVLGREIAALVNEVKSPGNYAVTFDASGLPSGVYFYQLTAGNFTERRKMVLMR